jgi:hypothetical protein
MPFGFIRCPECRVRGRRNLVAPERRTFEGTSAPVFAEERVCLNCGAWLWVVAGEVMPAAPRLLTMSAAPASEIAPRLEAVLAGIAATEAYQKEFNKCLEQALVSVRPEQPDPRRP